MPYFSNDEIIGNFSDEKPSGGIVPDIVVKPSKEDIVKEEDIVLKAIKTIIGEK